MATYSTMAALEAALRKELRAAMNESMEQAQADLEYASSQFYAGGTPIRYERTYQLASAAETKGVYDQGNSMFFNALYNQDGGYGTGKMPSMAAVLTLTNDGAYPGLRSAVGMPGYWQIAESRIKADTLSIFGSHFS